MLGTGATTPGLSIHRFRILLIAAITLVSVDNLSGQNVTTCTPTLNCIRDEIDSVSLEALRPTILSHNEAFEALAEQVGYTDERGSVEVLKNASKYLKNNNAQANYDAISLLDNAIASHKNDFRSALSPTEIARKSLEVEGFGIDIQPRFVEQKLK
jgi:hypothetical protein